MTEKHVWKLQEGPLGEGTGRMMPVILQENDTGAGALAGVHHGDQQTETGRGKETAGLISRRLIEEGIVRRAAAERGTTMTGTEAGTGTEIEGGECEDECKAYYGEDKHLWPGLAIRDPSIPPLDFIIRFFSSKNQRPKGANDDFSSDRSS